MNMTDSDGESPTYVARISMLSFSAPKLKSPGSQYRDRRPSVGSVTSLSASMMLDLPLLFSPTRTVNPGRRWTMVSRHDRKLVRSRRLRCTLPVQHDGQRTETISLDLTCGSRSRLSPGSARKRLWRRATRNGSPQMSVERGSTCRRLLGRTAGEPLEAGGDSGGARLGS